MSPPWRECLSVSLALVVFVNVVLARPNDVDPHLYCAGCQATLKEISKKLSGTPAKESHVMEAMENICTPENFVSYEYSPPRSIRACRALMDEHEDAIEKAFTQRKQNMEQYICYEISKACEGVDMSGKTQTSDIDLTGGAAIDGVKSSGLGDDIRVGNVNVGGDEIKVENMKVQSEPEEEEEEEEKEDIPEPDLKTEDGWEDAKLEDIEGEIDLMKTSPVVNVANHELADKKEEKKEDTTDKKEENKEDTTDKKEEQSSPAKSDVNKVEEKTEEASLTAEKEAEPKQVNADKKKKREIQKKKKKKKGGKKVTKKSSKRSKRMSRKQRKRLALKKKQQRRRKLRKQYRKAKKAARKSKKSKKSKKQKRKTHKKKIVKVEANDKAKEEVKEKKEGEKVEEKSMMVEVSPEKVEKEAEKVEIEAEQVAEKSNKEPGVKISEEKKADANEQLPSEQVKEEL